MLERYYLRPRRIERIRACWFGEKIDLFVRVMADQGYRPRFITRRVLILEQFAEFTAARGTGCFDQAEAVVDTFADYWLARRRTSSAGLPLFGGGGVIMCAARSGAFSAQSYGSPNVGPRECRCRLLC